MNRPTMGPDEDRDFFEAADEFMRRAPDTTSRDVMAEFVRLMREWGERFDEIEKGRRHRIQELLSSCLNTLSGGNLFDSGSLDVRAQAFTRLVTAEALYERYLAYQRFVEGCLRLAERDARFWQREFNVIAYMTRRTWEIHEDWVRELELAYGYVESDEALTRQILGQAVKAQTAAKIREGQVRGGNWHRRGPSDGELVAEVTAMHNRNPTLSWSSVCTRVGKKYDLSRQRVAKRASAADWR